MPEEVGLRGLLYELWDWGALPPCPVSALAPLGGEQVNLMALLKEVPGPERRDLLKAPVEERRAS